MKGDGVGLSIEVGQEEKRWGNGNESSWSKWYKVAEKLEKITLWIKNSEEDKETMKNKENRCI